MFACIYSSITPPPMKDWWNIQKKRSSEDDIFINQIWSSVSLKRPIDILFQSRHTSCGHRICRAKNLLTILKIFSFVSSTFNKLGYDLVSAKFIKSLPFWLNNWDKVIKSLLSVSISKSLVELCNSFDSIMVLLIKEVCTKIIKSAGIPGTDSGLGGGGGYMGVYRTRISNTGVYTTKYWTCITHIWNIHHKYWTNFTRLLNTATL